jgi:hypothetical protein
MWVDLVAWFQSPGGARVLQTAIIPALAILVAGLLAALIARSAVRATLRRAERVEAASAVAGLVSAARISADSQGDPVALRRAVRLRAEADVRTRLLPLQGADLAADWAGARTDALQLRGADAPVTAELAELRDRLVEWVGRPGRAKRLFVTAAPAASRAAKPAPAPEPVSAAPTPDAAPVQQAEPSVLPEPDPEPQGNDQGNDRFARPGPRRHPAEAEPAQPSAPEAEPAAASAVPAGVAVPAGAAVPVGAAPAAAAADALPAWQRTRAMERLQQERGRGRSVEPPAAEEEAASGTAPVQLPRPHRAEAAQPAAPAASAPAPAPESDEAVRLEAHQQARHARPEGPTTATGTVPAPTSTPAPAWLDTYDDEAQVTQNLNLKTPPPVAASAVRDRGPGDDLVPRS